MTIKEGSGLTITGGRASSKKSLKPSTISEEPLQSKIKGAYNKDIKQIVQETENGDQVERSYIQVNANLKQSGS